jgi:hypothetical protein
VMVAGPIKASVMSEFLPSLHIDEFVFLWPCRRGAVGCRSDTRSLTGYSSLRHFDSRRRRGR